MPTPLALDAVLSDAVPLLRQPEEDVRRILEMLGKLREGSRDVVVRIGVAETGKPPNYRIDLEDTPLAAFDGATHRAFPGMKRIETEAWSTASMTYLEVRTMLGKLRGFVKKGPAARGKHA
ncbi:hypothetical protein [Lichenicoccus roseus]|uniref:Uncharacterized protein n=1 Tax=Lichenicoccus roseus TaxID=2683649 RepID=A0A5R9JHX9_9PROT|nr:hypothetical protein [Lichenicoccus roseus]TLU73928.1 hypothetical protein FE263_01510 [Lichenicoccus roseus]